MSTRKPKVSDLATKPAVRTADNFMAMASRAALDYEAVKSSGGSDAAQAMLMTSISAYAFAIEVYIKVLTYVVNRRVLSGHNLTELWNDMDPRARQYVEESFAHNFKSTGKDWDATSLWSARLAGKSNVESFVVPGITAAEVMRGHAKAFVEGRYFYEIKDTQSMKIVLHNIPGLSMIARILRDLAVRMVEATEAENARVRSLPKEERPKSHSTSVSLRPHDPVPDFPTAD